MPPAQRRPRRSFEWSTALLLILVVTAGGHVYWRDGADHFFEILRSDSLLFVDLLPKMLAGCLIGAFVTMLLPREVVSRWVGAESGLSGLAIAIVTGAFLPGGPFTIYPIAGAFLALGADVGTAIAFVTSWTLLGYNRALVWELPFFGPDFVLWRIIVSLPLPLLTGLAARAIASAVRARLGRDPWTEEIDAQRGGPPP